MHSEAGYPVDGYYEMIPQDATRVRPIMQFDVDSVRLEFILWLMNGPKKAELYWDFSGL